MSKKSKSSTPDTSATEANEPIEKAPGEPLVYDEHGRELPLREVDGLAQGEHYPPPPADSGRRDVPDPPEAPVRAPEGERVGEEPRERETEYTGQLGANVAEGTSPEVARTVPEGGLFIPPPNADGTPHDFGAEPESAPQPPPIGTRIDPRLREQQVGGEAPLLPFLASYADDFDLVTLVRGKLDALSRDQRLGLLTERTPIAVADAVLLSQTELETTVGQLLLQEVLAERAAAAASRYEPTPQAPTATEEPYGGDAPQHYVVLEQSRFASEGQLVTLEQSAIINDRTHDIEALKRGGVKLIACAPPDIHQR